MDWLEKLSKSLQPEQPSPEWRTVNQIASALGRTVGAAKFLATQKVQSGEWQKKAFRVAMPSGVRLVDHFKPTSATAARH